jgi:hypothetical protein
MVISTIFPTIFNKVWNFRPLNFFPAGQSNNLYINNPIYHNSNLF